MADCQSILDQLVAMYKDLQSKKTLTEYTANEARNISIRAKTLIIQWPIETEEMPEIKSRATEMLNASIAAADKFYDNYDYVNRQPKRGSGDYWRAVTEAINGIDFFIDAVLGNGE